MHEELRIRNNSLNEQKVANINKKGNLVFFSQECSCYNSENCFALASPHASFTSLASFALSSSSSSSIQPVGNTSPHKCEQRCNVGNEHLKKHCCIPSTSLSSTSFSMSESSKLAISPGTNAGKFNIVNKQMNGNINTIVNSSLTGFSEKNMQNTTSKVGNGKHASNTVSNSNIAFLNGICYSNVKALSQEESDKLAKQQSRDIDTSNINTLNHPKLTTYECDNTYTGCSSGALNGTDIDNINSSITNSNPAINSASKITKISKPSILGNKSQVVSKNYSLVYKRLYDCLGPVMFPIAPLKGIKHPRGELRLWPTNHDRVISQNSSKRKVHRSLWIPPKSYDHTFVNDLNGSETISAYPMALKFVEDGNARDGRSIKREIECHLYIYQRLSQLQQDQGYDNLEDAWPCAELIGYYLDKKNPGNSVLVTRKLSGPDFFDIIRSEHSSSANLVYSKCQALYEYNKLQWCTLALTRIAQYSALGIRHNDIKPDNIVLDFYYNSTSKERHLDVKIIDLGTASMHSAKDFTGGTSWYESPEQKMLEYYTKKSRDLKSAKTVEIGLSSDSWGAGISIAEVLMGRRVVDSMKSPYGPGPLEFKGKEGWLMDPQEWIEFAKMALGFDNSNCPYKYKICEEAAKYVFNMLVQVNSNKRANIKDVIQKMDYYTQKAYQVVKQKHQA
ncbi:Ser Thr kinase [Cryptosporidium sp. chipmunk genotype I]|uniref:Ser Thr kinase n=1 Tax=Cryptosporidium sp. chipmunk genotype I TaxID=1280935 RepID=UPI003519E705|nr:Ser Thr kinase [Cryptosporidium sp. chipmunk genotype I]